MTHVSATRKLHRCEECGKDFYPKRYCHTRFCGQTCGKAHTGRQAKERARLKAEANKEERERKAAERKEARAKQVAERKAQWLADAPRRAAEKIKRDALAKAEHYKPRPCKQCGETFQPEKRKTIKCKPCVDENMARGKRSKKQQERARAKGLPGARYECFDPYEIFERDGWTCQGCGKETPKALRGLNLMDSPELDHVRALRAGGNHTPDNTQCLCRACNVAKSYEDAEEVRAFESAESMMV